MIIVTYAVTVPVQQLATTQPIVASGTSQMSVLNTQIPLTKRRIRSDGQFYNGIGYDSVTYDHTGNS